jgi:hypothetical protein
MSNRSTYVVGGVAICAILAATGIMASNMGYKLNKPLYKPAPAISKSGTNTLGLPYFRQTGLDTSFTLIQDIENGGPPFSKVVSISKCLEASDTLQVYTGRMASPGPNFALAPADCLYVQMSSDLNYLVVGSQDPAFVISLDAPSAASKSGTNCVALPYNSSVLTAFELMKDIEGIATPPFSKVVSISKFLTGTDTLQTYTGRMGTPGLNFNILPGDCYKIQMSVAVPYLPSHY